VDKAYYKYQNGPTWLKCRPSLFRYNSERTLYLEKAFSSLVLLPLDMDWDKALPKLRNRSGY